MKTKQKVKFELPSKVEGFLVFAMAMLIFLIDILQNKIQDFGMNYVVTYASAGKLLPAIDLFWIAVFTYTIITVFLFSRNIWEGRLDRKVDILFGIFMFVGLVLLVAGAVAGFTHSAPQPVSWFYYVPQITFYHIGMLFSIIGGLWFAITK
jgi:hypothetical protein